MAAHPVGLVPKHIWDAKRKMKIKEAIIRYVEANQPIPVEWVEEYNELLELR